MRLIIAALASAVALAGCASATHQPDPRSTGVSAQSPAPSRNTSPPARHSPAPVSARVVLPTHTMEAGSHITAQVVVDNNTGHALHEGGCGSLFQVVLVGRHYHPQVAWATCLQMLTIPAGVSRYRMPVYATYNRCSQDGAQPGLRPCPPQGMPPLPPGEYHATLFQSGHIVPAPPAVTVLVTPPASPAPLVTPPASPTQ